MRESAQVITDRDTGRSKGFDFVEMVSDAEARAAITRLNETEHDGRPLTVTRQNRARIAVVEVAAATVADGWPGVPNLAAREDPLGAHAYRRTSSGAICCAFPVRTLSRTARYRSS